MGLLGVDVLRVEVVRRRKSPGALSVDIPPPTSFRSSGGRLFVVSAGVVDDIPSRRMVTFTVSLDGREVGSVSRSTMYPIADGFGWSGSLNPLRWSVPGFVWAAHRVGYDVAAFATAGECVEAWARSADQILDWTPE